MNRRDQAWNSLLGSLGAWLPFFGGIGVLILSALLRNLESSSDPLLFGQLQFTSGIVAITFAGAAFVRFRGTQDRLPLILAAGFVIVGIALASSSLSLPALSLLGSTATLRDPMTWVIGRTLLAILLVSALLVQKWLPWSRNPGREIAAALVLVVLISTLLSTMHRHLPSSLVVQPGHLFPRPGNLIPAALFLLTALAYHRRLKNASTVFDCSLYFAAVINFWCSVAAAQSDRGLDATFALAAVLQFSSYAVLLGGTLLDDLRLFQDIQRSAVTDPVTGLANYRHFIDALEIEIQRSGRTGRPFALLLFDLDRLKELNDQFGHQVGTHALRRAADVIRFHSRAIDTAARHGGDEFALVLPETTEQGAQEVLSRICDRVTNDVSQPTISLSGDFAIYPRDADTAETLMDAGDRALYRMKEQHKRNASLVKKAPV
ncbi:MAG TPA: GGDEF domain-containing protein [Candidatus Acidoferrum sp.]|nr:GGDEF domain-containing protein [Candidatus Acidoferrum sp.]